MTMTFDHERLDVYQCALQALDLCDAIVDQMPAGRAHLKDQLDRAATSVVLNVAEGAGEFSSDEKRRFYRIAKRSATESAAILHIIARRGHAAEEQTSRARHELARIVSMLVKMTNRAQSRSGTGTGTGTAAGGRARSRG